jgi:hypothetical protein
MLLAELVKGGGAEDPVAAPVPPRGRSDS